MEAISSASFVLLLPLLFGLLLVFLDPLRRRRTRRSHSIPATLRRYPIIGNLPQYLEHRHRLLEWQTELLAASPTNTIFSSRFGNLRDVTTANPANVEHFLKTNFDNYRKGPRCNSILEDFLGRGIFNADDELWRAQRKTASHEFNTRSLRTFVVENVQREIRGRLVPLLERAAGTGAVVDLQDVLERFAFDNVCRVAFNEDPACLAGDVEGGENPNEARRLSPEFASAFRCATSITFDRFRYAIPRMWRIKKLLNVGSERRLRKSVSTVHDFAMQIVRSRKKEKEDNLVLRHRDLLSRFISAPEGSSDEYLRDIVISFILAGRETTSSALTWFFWLLSSRPAVEHRILDEVRSVRAAREGLAVPPTEADGETFAFEELKEMHYLHASISEAMRLYPPVPFNHLVCGADDMLPDGTVVERGWFVSYSPYSMARMPALWGDDCEEYKPERWLDDGGRFRPESQFKYPVFHAGHRACLGKEMAYIQMKSIVACVLERFEVEVDRERRPGKILALTLRMEGGLPSRLRKRMVS